MGPALAYNIWPAGQLNMLNSQSVIWWVDQYTVT